MDAAALQDANEASQLVSAASVETLEALEIYKLVGRIEAAHFTETVSAKMAAETYLKVRSLLGKLGEITVRDASGSPKRVSDMETFCELAMPFSARRCQQIVSSMEVLGSELYEQAQLIGFRARDYQALKALPNDDQEAVKQAIQSGTRDEVVDLLTDLAARNKALRDQAKEAQKQLATKDRQLGDKSKKIDALDADLRLARREGLELAEAEGAQVQALRDTTLDAEQTLLRLLAEVDDVLRVPATEAAEACARHSVDYLVQRIVDACMERGITVDLAERVSPLWNEPIEAAAAAGTGKRRK